MEEERVVPRRLLSFDATQMSLSRLGKALYPGSSPRLIDSNERKQNTNPNANISQVYAGTTNAPLIGLAKHPNERIAALLSRDQVELIQVDDQKTTSLTTIKPGRRNPLAVAEWQPSSRWRQWSPGYDEPSSASSHGSFGIADHNTGSQGSTHRTSNKSSSSSSQLAVADSGGVFCMYQLHSGGSSLALTQTSMNVGRAIRSMSFNSVQPNVLLTAVSDGIVRLWDLRQGLKRPTSLFSRTADVVREVQFQPESDYKFACIYDSGVVQRWDMRQRQAPDYRINAHQQGLSLDWHPHLSYLATGGRDRLVQVWNLSGASGSPGETYGLTTVPEYVIQAPMSISRLKWSTLPSERVSKASLVVGGRPIESNSLRSMYYSYKIERPWIAEYCVESHADAVTDFAIRRPTTIWSVGRDGRFIQTDLRSEPKVADNLSPIVIGWEPTDFIGVALPQSAKSSRRPSGQPVTPLAQQYPAPGQHAISHSASVMNLHMESSSAASRKLSLPPTISPHAQLQRASSTLNLELQNPLSQIQPKELSGASASDSFQGVSSTQMTPNTPGASSHPGFSQGYFSDLQSSIGDSRFLIELGLPLDTNIDIQSVSNDFAFNRTHGHRYSDVCEWNAVLMQSLSRFRQVEEWKMLGLSIDQLQRSFEDTLTDDSEKELAKTWFAGTVDDNFEVRATSINDRTTREEASAVDDGALFEDVDEDRLSESAEDQYWSMSPQMDSGVMFSRSQASEGSSSVWSGRSERKTDRKIRRRNSKRAYSLSKPSRPSLIEKDPFHILKDKFFRFAESKQMPWDFVPILRNFLTRAMNMGWYITGMAVVLIFRAFPDAFKVFEAGDIFKGGLRMLRHNGAFLAEAQIRKIVQTQPEFQRHPGISKFFDEDSATVPDTVCHRCTRSLNENASFYARNDAELGFWYCSKCRQLLDGCSYCEGSIKGLCRVVLGCGHRIHLSCWRRWVDDESMSECPAGCGQELYTV